MDPNVDSMPRQPGATGDPAVIESLAGSGAETLFTSLYNELHSVARRELTRNGRESLGVTTLLHETCLNMAARDGASFPDRPRFMAYAARVMRGLIIDHARSRRAL